MNCNEYVKQINTFGCYDASFNICTLQRFRVSFSLSVSVILSVYLSRHSRNRKVQRTSHINWKCQNAICEAANCNFRLHATPIITFISHAKSKHKIYEMSYALLLHNAAHIDYFSNGSTSILKKVNNIKCDAADVLMSINLRNRRKIGHIITEWTWIIFFALFIIIIHVSISHSAFWTGCIIIICSGETVNATRIRVSWIKPNRREKTKKTRAHTHLTLDQQWEALCAYAPRSCTFRTWSHWSPITISPFR